MRILALAALAALTAGWTGCINITGWNTVHGNGHIVTEPRQVAGFDRVSVAGSGQVILAQGDEESLTIEADENLLPLIKSDVDHGHLFIGPRDVNLGPTKTIVYRLKLKNIRALHLSGSLHAETEKIETDQFAVHISGSGGMKVAQLKAGTFSAQISGSGSTSAAGNVQRQEIRISGSGNHHASGLKCTHAEAHITGSGDASVWVVESLDAYISGSGSVEYRGNPSVDSHVSGSGRIHHRGD